jgi:hypothetical protein
MRYINQYGYEVEILGRVKAWKPEDDPKWLRVLCAMVNVVEGGMWLMVLGLIALIMPQGKKNNGV